MKPKNLLLLSLFTLGLGLFIAFYEKDLPSTDERKAQENQAIPVAAEKVTRVTLSSKGEPQVTLERVPELEGTDDSSAPSQTWRITEPVQVRADSEAIADLINRLVALQKRRTLEDPDMAQLGLENPEISVVLSTEKGPFELHVGSELPLSGDRALRGSSPSIAFQGSPGPELLEMIQRKAGSWRDKRLFVEPRNAIEGLILSRKEGHGEEEIHLQRFGEGEKYRLTAPFADAADDELVRSLLTALVGLRAESFAGGDGAPDGGVSHGGGLDPAQAELTVMLGPDTAAWSLELGSPRMDQPDQQWVRFGSSPENREIARITNPDLEAAIYRSAEAWRSKDWSTLQVFGIEKASFSGVGEAIHIERPDGGEWLRGSDRIEYSAASDALYPFTEIKAQTLISRDEAAGRFDLSKPRLSATLSTEDREEVLHLFNGDDQLSPATLEGRDTVLLIGREEADQLLEKINQLRLAPTVVETLE